MAPAPKDEVLDNPFALRKGGGESLDGAPHVIDGDADELQNYINNSQFMNIELSNNRIDLEN